MCVWGGGGRGGLGLGFLAVLLQSLLSELLFYPPSVLSVRTHIIAVRNTPARTQANTHAHTSQGLA